MPFLGKTPAQIVDPEVDIDGGSIDGATIGATSASTATVTTFTSTGIDDNATSTAITIDASENVGINTAQPVSLLDVLYTAPKITANSNSFATGGNGTGFGIYRSAFGRQAGYTWTIENAAQSGGSTTADYQTDSLVFKARVNVTDSSLTDRVVLGPNGNVQITDGNLVVANGHGIDFSATGQASGMTSELLDDYEEGTFTPTLTTSNGDLSATYSVSGAYYRKIGKAVYFQAYFQAILVTSAGTGNPRMGNLPFYARSGAHHTPCSFSYENAFNVDAGGYVQTGQNFVQIMQTTSNAANSFVVQSSGRAFMISGFYFTP